MKVDQRRVITQESTASGSESRIVGIMKTIGCVRNNRLVEPLYFSQVPGLFGVGCLLIGPTFSTYTWHGT